MEMSSPLAAMHPPPVPGPWGYRRDLPASKPLFAGHSFAPKNFNFRDLSMKKSAPDYFTLQPMRGSSPTASLAADMSSNLHMDQSPQLVTPRRSLFTTNIFPPLDAREEITTPPVRWEGVTTPPIPSSSPGFVPDSMDMSPLPHKAPFSYITSLPSPTPEAALAPEEEMISPCEVAPPVLNFDAPRPASSSERRKSILNRPSLGRSKHYSTNTVSFKSRESTPLPAFKFGAGPNSFNVSAPSLDECFTASPPQERKQIPYPSVLSRPKPFALNTSVSRANGSPLSANVRKPAGPPARPRSKFRRSLSMFEHPGDVMNQSKDNDTYTPSGLQSVMDVDDTPSLKLPHFVPSSEPDSLPRIDHQTLIDVLNGEYDHVYEKALVVDCRFEYEYDGGHIEGALNFCDKEQLASELFTSPPPNTLLIFHCEYSAHRAPLMAKFVRNEDRQYNAAQYPQLSYPEVYILDGGYSSFYESHRTRCFPQNYLRMDAKEHEDSCERGMNKLRQRSKLSRAQTFAFGQQSCQMEDSPTAAGRSRSGGVLSLGGGDDMFSLGRIGTTRRMASY
ncbi:Rhodanese-like protein [Polyplosphaeria fusca]|uniref:M-phase inducer phosphatase n=1 Tax=Polyplosphaeria fusca TaxID=682080 RepID=A0A9P4R0T2_9PLEO|nr:Rhodanese-like protein [Polyplosphaeria fusca]